MSALFFPSPFGKSPHRKFRGFTLIEVMIVMLIMFMIVAIAAPAWIRARSQSRMKSCQENLSKIDGVKEQWALEHHKLPDAIPDETDLVLGPNPHKSGYLAFFPVEPSGGAYVIGSMSQAVTCNTGFPGHDLASVGQAITELEQSGGTP